MFPLEYLHCDSFFFQRKNVLLFKTDEGCKWRFQVRFSFFLDFLKAELLLTAHSLCICIGINVIPSVMLVFQFLLNSTYSLIVRMHDMGEMDVRACYTAISVSFTNSHFIVLSSCGHQNFIGLMRSTNSGPIMLCFFQFHGLNVTL